MNFADLSPEDRHLVDSLLGSWEDAVARGDAPRPEMICPDRPDLWEAVVARAAQLEAMAFLDGQTETRIAPDDRLAGRYRLIEQLATGGHAVVWRAHDETLNRGVAVKLIAVGPLAAPQRLIDEGQRLAGLSHPNIVSAFDAGIEGEIAYLVQEFVTGETLAHRIEAGPLPADRAIAWVSQIAAALQAAHDDPARIIHCDVKPANILIDGHGNALLADFGIALSSRDAAGNTSVGTLPYKSPEQLDGRPLDRRSDVFSLALVLYEALTGRLPYSGSDADTIRREMREPLAERIARLPGPRPLPAEYLPPLERALAPYPEGRPRDAIAFRDELLEAARMPAPSTPRTHRLTRVLATTAIVGGLAAATLIASWSRQPRPAPPAEPRPAAAGPAAPPEPAAPPVVPQEVEREVERGMQVFREAQGRLADIMKLDREIREQTRQRDHFRRDPQSPAAPPTLPRSPRRLPPADESSSEQR